MKPTTFTGDIGNAIVASVKKWCKTHPTSYCSPVCYYTTASEAQPTAEICHRPALDNLKMHYNTDIFGVIYRGWTKDNANTEGLGPEAKQYLSALMNPKGPFAELFQFMWKTDVDEILEDKVIVFKDLSTLRDYTGLFWTFAQATRFMFEQPQCMDRFLHLQKTLPDPVLSLFLTYCIQPVDKNSMNGNWTFAIQGHCAPLGVSPFSRADGFLACKLKPWKTYSTIGSAECFGNSGKAPFIHNYYRPTQKPLGEWIEKMAQAAA